MAYRAELYVHDLDRQASDALNQFPKFVRLLESYSANYDEKAAKIDLLSTAIRLSENQMPEVYGLLPPICEQLGIDTPELYYVRDKRANAATFGSVHPCIYVTSGLMDTLPLKLLPSVLAHECGHIACKHSLCHSIAAQLADGIDRSPLVRIPAIGKYITPTLVRALLFWDRCSELSADRAAVLCDGTADKTIDVLLRLNGYGKNVNREEFLKQALDLKSFVNDSKSNKLLELMLVQDESHPRLATRAYECYEWSQSAQYSGIIDGTFTLRDKEKETAQESEEEVVAANAQAETPNIDRLNAELARVTQELDRYTNHADKADYALAVFSGIISGAIDALFIGEVTITGKDIALSNQQVNNFIQEYAKSRGFENSSLKDAIRELENTFKVAQDNVWKGAGIGISAKNHHLADLAHHPTPVGLLASLVVQFLRIGTFVSRDGKWHFIVVETHAEDVKNIMIPAVITGILNWLAFVAEKKLGDNEIEIPKGIQHITYLLASTPIIIEIIKCADNWFGHLVSDMCGSKNTAGGGMGIPGIFLSLLYEISGLPVLRNSGLPAVVNELYEKQKIDLRHELPLYKVAGKQAIPVIFNELYIRIGYFLSHLAGELASGEEAINWNRVIPFRNRTVDRMLTIAGMTFTVADTADAAIHAAIESGGNWVLFSGRFVTRFNYVGAGRAALSIVREVSNEKKEAQIIHEKMILSEAKAALFLKQLQEFKAQLDLKVSNYLAEDIESFMSGFEDMQQGLSTGDSDLVIRGNVTIQKVLGREPQFTNQEEFDALMESDAPLVL